MGSPTISRQKVLAAARGNSDLLEVLHQVIQTTEQTQIATGTQPRAKPVSAGLGGAGKTPVSRSASVPPQATGSVSLLGSAYVMQLVNPGGTSPLSQLQAAQAAGKATNLTTLQPIIPIYHQIRASTSPAFNVNSNTQTFGGNTGSTQTYWTLTGIGKGTWYFQFRSSYDGVNFNTWRNANSGTALGGLINQVTTVNAGNSDWALFTLPGSLVMGVGAGVVADRTIFDLPEQVYSSGMAGIAAPNGFTMSSDAVYGVTECNIELQIPTTGTTGVVGTPDFPVEIQMEYGVSGTVAKLPGIANVFMLAFDPSNEYVTIYEEGGSSTFWASFLLPGGARIAIGMGRNNDGETIWTPAALPWIIGMRVMSICSLTDATDNTLVATGYEKCQLSGLDMQAKILDAHGATWSTSANWMAIAWELGTNVETVGGFPFLHLPLQGGHGVVIGAGQGSSGAAVTLPTGYSIDGMLGVVTPAGTDAAITHHLRGIQQCAFSGLIPLLTYTDNSNYWSGPVNWMLAAWK